MRSNEERDSQMVKNQLEAEKNNLGMLLRIWKDDKVHVEAGNVVGNMNFMK